MNTKKLYLMILTILMVQFGAITDMTASNAVNSKAVASVFDETITKDVYIGEAFKSKFVYIEPFAYDRGSYNETYKIKSYPTSIQFYPLDELKVIRATNAKKITAYIPNSEPDSVYYSQEFSRPDQQCLRYITKVAPKRACTGIVLFNHGISKATYENKGKKRPYTKAEYKLAVAEVKEDKKIEESMKTLDYIGLENTIVGAIQICTFKVEDQKIEMVLSKYDTHSTEYAGTVYVIDFIKNGKVVKTIEKYNSDGPY